MSRFALFAGAGIALIVSACSHRQSVRTVASTLSGNNCTVALETANLSNWKEVQSEGFTFCVPANWKLDDKFQLWQSNQYSRPNFRMLAWASPDSTQRVVFDLPLAEFATNELRNRVARCRYDNRNGEQTIGEQPACIDYAKPAETSTSRLNNPNGVDGVSQLYRPDVTVTYSAPVLRARANGVREAFTVLETVRPVAAVSQH